MKRGILLGVVLSMLIAVAIALATSEERRHQLSHRLEELRKALPDGEQLKHSAQEVVGAAQQTAASLGANLQEKSSDLVNGFRDRW